MAVPYRDNWGVEWGTGGDTLSRKITLDEFDIIDLHSKLRRDIFPESPNTTQEGISRKEPQTHKELVAAT